MPTQNIAKYSGTTTPPMDNSGIAAGIRYDTADGFLKYDDSGTARVLVDTAKTQTISGTKTFTGATSFTTTPTFTGDGGLQYAEVSLTNAEIKALRATPKTIVAAPAAGKVVVPAFGIIVLIAGTNVLTESTANLALKYTDGSGTQISETVEATGFIDQAASTMTTVRIKQDGIVAKTAADAKAVVLHNLGAGEYGGNAAADATLKVKLWYSIASPGW